jgi:nicotinamidase/pyrazinamidase
MTSADHDIGLDDRTALLVVDVQNDFADPAGNLYVAGGDAIIPAINDLVTRAEQRGATVVYTQDWHPGTTPHFEKDGGTWPTHCVADTWGAALHPELHVAGPAVRKGTGGEDGYSGFTARDVDTGEHKATDLHGILTDRGITRVVVVGLAQDVCVKETALDAQRLGYHTTVVADATRPVNREPDDGERAFAELADAGVAVR